MIQLKILSPTQTVFDGKVTHVTFPGGLGSFSVFPSHAPLISTLVKGSVTYYPVDGEKEIVAIDGGFVEVKENQLTACIEQSSKPEKE
jgi:F-type H+-transporting ATPase subunit epsilon